MRRHLLSTAAWILVAAAAVAGCDSGSDDESGSGASGPTSDSPTSDSPATGSTAPGASKASNAPKPPAAAEKDDAAGAEAYVGYFVDLVNYAAESGDTKPLHDAAVECDYCQQFPAVYDDVYSNGGSFDGDFFRLLDVNATGEGDTTQAVAKLKADTSTTFKIAKDKKTQHIEPVSYTWTIDLEPTDDGWQITGMKEKF
ncbi:DUF6318 family protein [Solicola gregarius]|uniref:DUF6318 family protein n=1 Tax=Solicola gregarius TaxID=2908642 RepID=A0AA46TI33_9ACTN|nr:DUF6318 family protein [Solicola gregarius]UYM05553.1 DUF6318 family protein [Solicola gregarius]